MFHEPLPEPSRDLPAHHARAPEDRSTDHLLDEVERIVSLGGPLVEWRLERLQAALDYDINDISTTGGTMGIDFDNLFAERPQFESEAAMLDQEDSTLKADLALALEMEDACVTFLCDGDRRAAATLTEVQEAQTILRDAHERAAEIGRRIEFNRQLGLNAEAAAVFNPFDVDMHEMVDAELRIESQRLYGEIMSAWLDAMHPWQRRLFGRLVSRGSFQRAWCALCVNPRPEFQRHQGGEWVGVAVWNEWPWYTRLHDAARQRRDMI